MKTKTLKKAIRLTLFMLLAFGMSQCKLFDTVDPDDKAVVEKTIGSEGGSIQSHTVEIVIPPGAFNDLYTIEVSQLDAQSSGFGGDEASVFYNISGIPLNIGAPLQIKIETDGGSMDGLLATMGETVYVKSLDSDQLVYHFHAGTSSGNQYQVLLSPEPENQQYTNETIDLTFGLVRNYRRLHVSSEKQFPELKNTDQIFFELVIKEAFFDHVVPLADYLTEAYYKIKQDLGFDYSARTKWPVKVTISDLGNEAFGYFNSSKRGNNYGSLSLNQRKLTDLTEMRVTIGHEFFHLIQSLYDPRWSYTKAISPGPWLWMDEATAIWVEEKFSDNPAYASNIRSAFVKAPLHGLIIGAQSGTQDHGYGMSAFIKYVVKKHGVSKIRQLYDQCKAGNNDLLNAINNVLGDNHSNYYPEFVNQYALQQLYNDFTHMNYGHDDFYVVNTATDTLKLFEKNFVPLSTKVYRAKINHTGFEAGSSLTFKNTGTAGNTKIFAYKTVNNVTSLLSSDLQEVQLDNLQQLQQENAVLWFFVVNYQNQELTSEKHSLTIHSEQQGDCPPEGVLIGSQCWMRQNLNVATGNSWCNNDDPANCAIYGRLYDWNTALTACPPGWHLPTDDEWKILEGTVDSQYDIGHVNMWNSLNWRGHDVGKKLKASYSWIENGNGTDAYGFGALAGGWYTEIYPAIGYEGFWWTATEGQTDNAYVRILSYNQDRSSRIKVYKETGLSVRCLKD